MKDKKPSPSIKQEAEKQIKEKIHSPEHMKKDNVKKDNNKEKKEKKVEGKRIELNAKEFKINFEKLQSDVKQAYESMRKLVPDSITEREIKPFGNAAHIILPKEYAHRMAKVIIKK